MGPYVEGLIGQLEEAQDAVSGWAAGVSVARDDAVLMENLEKRKLFISPQSVWQLCEPFFSSAVEATEVSQNYFNQSVTKCKRLEILSRTSVACLI